MKSTLRKYLIGGTAIAARGLGGLAWASTLMFSTPAFADCTGDVCGAMQKILKARSDNFAKLKGKPGVDPRGNALWEGTQTITGLIDYCYVYQRGESSHYEYHCDSSRLGTQAPQSLENAQQIAESVKTAFQSADPKLVWFEDPTALALANVEGFQETVGWYGGHATKKIVVRVAIVGSGDYTVRVSVFAKPLARRDLK
jgi:hypothetical protein